MRLRRSASCSSMKKTLSSFALAGGGTKIWRHICVRWRRVLIMSRIKELFAGKKKNVLSIYCTAGYPRLDSTLEVMKALQDNGADMIELGMPYSDPLADGPVIQVSSTAALANGMTLATLFRQLAAMRPAISVPVLLMGYMNPVL